MFIKRKKINTPPLQVEKAEQIFYLENVYDGNLVFDVGANVGELTALFSRFVGNKGQVHAFEPTPTTYKKLSKIIELTRKNNVVLNNLAVSDLKGEIVFNTYIDTHASWNTMANRPLEKYGIDIEKPKILKVLSVTIDEYCKENKRQCVNCKSIRWACMVRTFRFNKE